MERDEPTVNCLCCNSRPNTILAVWLALKTFLDLVIIPFLIYFIFLMQIFKPFEWNGFSTAVVVFSILSIIDIGFMAILSKGIKTKNVQMLKAVYYYCFYLLALARAFIIGFVVLLVSNSHQLGFNGVDVFIIVLIFCNIGLLVRVTLLLRSEIDRIKGMNRFTNSPPLNQNSGTKKPFQDDEHKCFV